MKNFLLMLIVLAMSMPAWAQTWSKDLEKSAKSGDQAAQLAVAKAYLNGDGVEKSLEKSAKWLYLATKSGNKEAEQLLLSFYSKDLEKYAKEGDAQAQYEVGMDYFAGTEIAKNTETAAKWFNLAQAQGHKEAREKLLSYYSKELEKVAKAGDAQAQYEVGMDYFAGTEIAKNTETAAKWFNLAQAQGHKEAREKLLSYYSKELEKVAKAGDAQAQYEVGMDYFAGTEIAKNTETAAKWFNLAQAQGHKEAREKFLSFYSKELEKVAKAGDAQAQYEVGMDYFAGTEIAKNAETAAKWFDMAKSQGHKEATDKLYTFYSKILENYAKQGESKAQYCVAEAYLNGVEVEQNYPKAANFFNKASLQGHKNAKTKLYSFYSKELKKLAKKDVNAQYALGVAYYNGVGTKKDTEEAGEYLSKAMDNGHKKAGELLYSFDSYAKRKRTYTVGLYGDKILTASKDPGQPFTLKDKDCYITGIATSLSTSPIRQMNNSCYTAYIVANITDSKIKINGGEEVQLTGPVTISVNFGKPLSISVFPKTNITFPGFGPVKTYETSTIIPGYKFETRGLHSINPVPYNPSLDELSKFRFDNYISDSKANINKDNIKSCSIEYVLEPDGYGIKEDERQITLEMNNGDIFKYKSYNRGNGYALSYYSSADKNSTYTCDIQSRDAKKFYKKFSDGSVFSYDENKDEGQLPDRSTFKDKSKGRTLLSVEDFVVNLSSIKDKDVFYNKVLKLCDDESFKSIRKSYDEDSKVGKGFNAGSGRPNIEVHLEITKNGTKTNLYYSKKGFLTQKQVDLINKDFDKKLDNYYKKLYSSYGKANVDAIKNGNLRKGMSIYLVDEFFDVSRDGSWNGSISRYYVGRIGITFFIVYTRGNQITDWYTY